MTRRISLVAACCSSADESSAGWGPASGEEDEDAGLPRRPEAAATFVFVLLGFGFRGMALSLSAAPVSAFRNQDRRTG